MRRSKLKWWEAYVPRRERISRDIEIDRRPTRAPRRSESDDIANLGRIRRFRLCPRDVSIIKKDRCHRCLKDASSTKKDRCHLCLKDASSASPRMTDVISVGKDPCRPCLTDSSSARKDPCRPCLRDRTVPHLQCTGVKSLDLLYHAGNVEK